MVGKKGALERIQMGIGSQQGTQCSVHWATLLQSKDQEMSGDITLLWGELGNLS